MNLSFSIDGLLAKKSVNTAQDKLTLHFNKTAGLVAEWLFWGSTDAGHEWLHSTQGSQLH